MGWTHLSKDKDQWQNIVNTVNKFWFLKDMSYQMGSSASQEGLCYTESVSLVNYLKFVLGKFYLRKYNTRSITRTTGKYRTYFAVTKCFIQKFGEISSKWKYLQIVRVL
jgi:hypothetical protein